jgi:hypothetical protein
MPTERQLDDRISRWLEAEAPMQLPDRVLRATLERTRGTRQQGGLQAVLRRTQMNRLIFALGGAAAVLVVAVMALGLYGNQPGGVGGQPSPSPSASPTAPPPSATPRSDPEGALAPGTYVFHPLRPYDSLAVTFTVPEGWGAMAGAVLLPTGDPGYGPPGGMAILFEGVKTVNGDPCHWLGTADDVSVGPAVDDLVDALLAQTAYEVSDPVDVTIGGYSGKRVDIVVPTEPFPRQSDDAPECDQGNYRLWSTVHGEDGIYVQGPADRWQTNILDVEGTRLVIVTRDFPGTRAADRAEMDAIIESLVIDP